MSQTEPKSVVYTPGYRNRQGFFSALASLAKTLILRRDLLWQLFKRDFLASYKKSFLGLIWIVLYPIFGIVSWVFLNVAGVLKPGAVDVPYPVYVLFGMTSWALFLSFYDTSVRTLNSSKELLMQVSFPREILLFKQVAQSLANFVAAMLVNLAVSAAFGVFPSWKIVFLPFAILPLFFLAAAIGLVISLVAVVATDIENFIRSGMGLLLWAMPVVYTDQVESPIVRTIFTYNPLTYLICSVRDLILFGRLYEPEYYFVLGFASFILFLLAFRLFYISEEMVIERVM